MAQPVRPPYPPENSSLNAFLVEIVEDITEHDVHKMKSLLTGLCGIGRGILEDILKPIDFFQKLQTTGYLTVNDTWVLQALLWTIGKKEVYKKTVEFAEQSDDVLHVCTPNPEPVNGFQYVKFHLKGKVDKNAVEDLRERISRWFRVPRHFVVISGVQPTGSWHITLMIPEICAEILRNFSDVQKKWLILQDIDTLELDGEIIDLTDSDGGKADVAEEDDVACKELQRLAKVNCDLENRISILSSQLVKEQRKVLYEEEPLSEDLPVITGSEDEIKRIDKKFAIHIGEFQAFSLEQVWPPERPRFHFLEILDGFVQQLQKNLEHIKHIKEKRQTDFNSEYDKSKPGRTGEDYYQDYLNEPSSQHVNLHQIYRDVHMNCNRLALYLRKTEKDVRVLRAVAAQYDSTPWIERNLSLIDQEVQTVEDYVKEYIEALKKITHTLIEKDISTDAPIRIGSENVITRFDEEFAFHVEKLQMFSSEFASSPGELNFEFVEIFDNIQQQLQNTLEHIKQTREKRQRDFNSEYDKSNPDQRGEDDVIWRSPVPRLYLGDELRYDIRARQLWRIGKQLGIICHHLEINLTDTEKDVRVLRLIAAQYDSASWVDRNLIVIDQELQAVEDYVKKYIEALKMIAPRLTEVDDSTEKVPMLKTKAAGQSSEPIPEPEIAHLSTSSAADEERKTSPPADEIEQKQLRS